MNDVEVPKIRLSTSDYHKAMALSTVELPAIRIPLTEYRRLSKFLYNPDAYDGLELQAQRDGFLAYLLILGMDAYESVEKR